MATREEMLANGNKYYCLHCRKCFKTIPQIMSEVGGHPDIDMCGCGCDLFANLKDDSKVG